MDFERAYSLLVVQVIYKVGSTTPWVIFAIWSADLSTILIFLVNKMRTIIEKFDAALDNEHCIYLFFK